MEELYKKLESFFEYYKRSISVNKLLSKFKVKNTEMIPFLEAIYTLEKKGKIYSLDGKNYIITPQDFYLKFGVLKRSSKGNFYLNLPDGNVIIISQKNLNGAKENDSVYVETQKNPKHSKQLIGNVVRVVSIPQLLDSTTFFQGIIKKDNIRNFYYVKVNNMIVYIPNKDLNGAYPGDLVSIQLNMPELSYGKVVEVIKRNNTRHVLEYKKNGNNCFWSGFNSPNHPVNVKLDVKEDFSIGDKILVDIDEKDNVTFIKKLDSSNNLKSYITNLLYDTGYPIDNTPATLKELESIKKNVDELDIKGRKDLRNLLTVSMDGDTAKDLDDAISLEYKDGKWYLYVHIADVSHFVKYGGSLFNDALNRGTSVYPINMVFHMLSEDLASGVCSLNEGEDKLTKTCLITLDDDANVLDCTIFNSVINNNKKMSYSKVNDYLDNGIINQDYIEFLNLLDNMNILSNKIQSKRIQTGYIAFENNEIEFNIGNDGIVQSFSDKKRGSAELIVENFMIIANTSIANIAYYYNVPFLFRNHEEPSIDQIGKLKDILRDFGIHFNTINNATTSKILQKVLFNLTKSKTEKEKIYISNQLLSCMNRAFYDVSSNGHYALAVDHYATFTSPIRKFSDLLNHYILDKIIKGDIDEIEKFEKDYSMWSAKCNYTRLLADKFEEHINQIVLNDFISQFIGETLEGNIVFMNNGIICVKTKNSIYGNIKVPKKSIINRTITIHGNKYKEGSPITVTIYGIKENSNEVIFSVANKEKEKVRKKEKNYEY